MESFEYDFSTAPSQDGDLIPAGTLAKAVLALRPGGMGPQGWLTQSKTSDALYLNCEFTICAGPYRNRKVFTRIGIKGSKRGPQGEDIWGHMGKTQLRALLESARQIHPKDMSEDAIEGRKINDYGDLQGLTCILKIGIERDESGFHPERNKVASFITAHHKDYRALMEGASMPQAPYPIPF